MMNEITHSSFSFFYFPSLINSSSISLLKKTYEAIRFQNDPGYKDSIQEHKETTFQPAKRPLVEKHQDQHYGYQAKKKHKRDRHRKVHH
jgi:hypothetical protein